MASHDTKQTKTHHTKRADKKVSNNKTPALVGKHIALASALIKKLNATKAEQKEFRIKYEILPSKDNKTVDPFDDKIGWFNEQLLAVKAAARAEWGTKVVKFRLPVVYTASTAGGGVLSATLPVNPTAQSEFTALGAVFDEFRVVGVRIRYNTPTCITAAANQSSVGVISYDPTDSTVLGAGLDGVQLEQHQLIHWPTYINAALPFPQVNGKIHTFVVTIPKGVFEINVVNGPIGGGQWQATVAAAYFSYGTIKTYGDGLVGGVPALTGFIEYHLEFRCRS
jgi:hypothetical protein